MKQIQFPVDRCVVCGAVVEEGRWVCAVCEGQVDAAAARPADKAKQAETRPRKFWWFFRCGKK